VNIKGIDVESIKWSQPLGLKQWCAVFGLNYKTQRNTLRRWFRDQTIRNKQVSPRYWRVAVCELPGELVAQALLLDNE